MGLYNTALPISPPCSRPFVFYRSKPNCSSFYQYTWGFVHAAPSPCPWGAPSHWWFSWPTCPSRQDPDPGIPACRNASLTLWAGWTIPPWPVGPVGAAHTAPARASLSQAMLQGKDLLQRFPKVCSLHLVLPSDYRDQGKQQALNKCTPTLF